MRESQGRWNESFQGTTRGNSPLHTKENGWRKSLGEHRWKWLINWELACGREVNGTPIWWSVFSQSFSHGRIQKALFFFFFCFVLYFWIEKFCWPRLPASWVGKKTRTFFITGDSRMGAAFWISKGPNSFPRSSCSGVTLTCLTSYVVKKKTWKL